MMRSKEYCRTCLKTSSLEPLFPSTDQCLRFQRAFYLSTGLQIKPNDGLPQKICRRCSKHIKNAMKFRLKSQNAEKRLLALLIPLNTNRNVATTVTAEDEYAVNIKLEYTATEQQPFDKDGDFNTYSTSPLREQNVSSDEDILDRIQPCPTKELDIKKSDFNNKIIRKETYSRKRALELVEGTLQPKQPVKCKLCKKLCNTFNSFEKHAMSHVGYNILCEFCGKSCISTSSLLRHQRAKHGLEKDNRFPCSFCDFRAIDKEQLEVHERKIHTKERPYTCDNCGAGFFSKRVLVQHTAHHKDDKPYQCDICPSKFKLRCALTGHTKRVHKKNSSTYTFGCHICHKRYCSTGDTRKHLLKVHGIPVDQQGKVHRFYYKDIVKVN